ncbi:MAG: hypothetical protein HFG45_09455 [Oscillospiraceae bacterium]|jgi:hypothetical protein|nr:hypothetical protein [Oscillospiraceae bacterium]
MPNRFEIPFSSANGGLDTAILTRVRPVFPYADGKRTSDVPTATSVTVALQGNCFEPLNIKIEGSADLFPGLTDEDIETACKTLKLNFVKFKNCKVQIYTIDGQMRMSGVADGVELVNSK